MKKLIAMLLALAAVVCLAACKEEAEPPAAELKRYECRGLAVYLGEEFQKQDMLFSAGYFVGPGATVQIWEDKLSNYDESITSSESFAQWHTEQTASQYDSMEIKSANGVYYTVTVKGAEHQVNGYYTNGTNGWIIQIVCAEVTDELIRYATSAEPMSE